MKISFEEKIINKRDDIHFFIDNENAGENEDLIPILFGKHALVLAEPATSDMWTLLWKAHLFTSKSEAKKNWKRTGRDIPEGFSMFERIGKMNTNLYIFNPVKSTLENE